MYAVLLLVITIYTSITIPLPRQFTNRAYHKPSGFYLSASLKYFNSKLVNANDTHTHFTTPNAQGFRYLQDLYHDAMANVALTNETRESDELAIAETEEGINPIYTSEFIRGFQSEYPAIYHPNCHFYPRKDAFTLWINCPSQPDLDNKPLSSHVCCLYFESSHC